MTSSVVVVRVSVGVGKFFLVGRLWGFVLFFGFFRGGFFKGEILGVEGV